MYICVYLRITCAYVCMYKKVSYFLNKNGEDSYSLITHYKSFHLSPNNEM